MFNKLEYIPIKNLTIEKLYKLYKKNEIDFNPDYQRFGRLWSKEKKQLLIDSIINNYDIPKFYFHYLSSISKNINKSNKLFAIIDGKQRLEAVFDFIEGNINLSSDFVFLKNENIVLKNLSFKRLDEKFPNISYKFLNHTFDMVFIDTNELERIEELFLRLNEGVPLNNAEKRKAIGGYLVNSLVKITNNHSFFLSKVRFSNKRLEHFDLLTKLVLLENNGINSFTKNNLDKLIRSNKEKNNSIESLLTKLINKLDIISENFNEKDELLRSKSAIPLYYLFFDETEFKDIDSKIKFLRKFEEIRKINRKEVPHREINQILIEYDRLAQQGAHQKSSLEKRLIILDRYLKKYTESNGIDIKTKISTADLGIKRLQIDNV